MGLAHASQSVYLATAEQCSVHFCSTLKDSSSKEKAAALDGPKSWAAFSIPSQMRNIDEWHSNMDVRIIKLQKKKIQGAEADGHRNQEGEHSRAEHYRAFWNLIYT